MSVILIALALIALVFCTVWFWTEWSAPWQPPGADEAERVLWDALDIARDVRPSVTYRRTGGRRYFVNQWGDKRAGEAKPGWLAVAWWDGATFADVELDHEAAHHALYLHDGVSMWTPNDVVHEDPRFMAYEARAQAALAKLGQR